MNVLKNLTLGCLVAAGLAAVPAAHAECGGYASYPPVYYRPAYYPAYGYKQPYAYSPYHGGCGKGAQPKPVPPVVRKPTVAPEPFPGTVPPAFVPRSPAAPRVSPAPAPRPAPAPPAPAPAPAGDPDDLPTDDSLPR